CARRIVALYVRSLGLRSTMPCSSRSIKIAVTEACAKPVARIRKGGEQSNDTPVVRTKVMAPCRDTVRLVNHDHANAHLEHVSLPVGVIQALRGNEEYLEVTRYSLLQRRPVLFWREVRTDDGCGYGVNIVAALALVAHQCFQRGEDD